MKIKMTKMILIGVILLSTIQTNILLAQTDIKPERIKKYIKKDNGKYGIQSLRDGKWVISPEYDNITGIMFTSQDKSHYEVNEIFYKLWKGTRFDLVHRVEKKINFEYDHEFPLIVNGAEAVNIPDKADKSSSSFSYQDGKGFVFFQVNNKWGWYKREQNGNVYRHQPKFDGIPEFFQFSIEGNYNGMLGEYLIVKDLNKKGVYSIKGIAIIPVDNYKDFTYKAREGFIEIVGENGFIGRASDSYFIPPLYVSLEEIEVSDYPGNRHFVQAKLSNGNLEYYEYGKLATNQYAELLKSNEEKDLKSKGLARLNTDSFSLKVYYNWSYSSKVINPNTIEVNLDKFSDLIFNNAPANWLGTNDIITNRKGMSGSMIIKISDSNSSIESIKSDLVGGYGNLAPLGVKNILHKSVTLEDGRNANYLLFYTNEMKGIGFKFKFIMLFDQGDKKIYSEIDMGGERSDVLQRADYEKWVSYFLPVLASIKRTQK